MDNITNTVTISIDEYFELRHKANENYFLMNEIGQITERINGLERRLNEIEWELKKVK